MLPGTLGPRRKENDITCIITPLPCLHLELCESYMESGLVLGLCDLSHHLRNRINIGALMIGIGFWRPFYYKYYKEPQSKC